MGREELGPGLWGLLVLGPGFWAWRNWALVYGPERVLGLPTSRHVVTLVKLTCGTGQTWLDSGLAKKTQGRPPPWAGKKTKGNGLFPLPPSSQGNMTISPGDGRGPCSRVCRGLETPAASEGRDSGVGLDKRSYPAKRPVDEGKRRIEGTPSDYHKRPRDDVGTPVKKSGHPLILEGVNQKQNAQSFWDLNDFGIGLKKGMKIIGDHDMSHLIPHSFSTLSQSIALNSCQTLSLVRALQIREEKSREDEVKLRRELAKLKECVASLEVGQDKLKGDVCRLGSENASLTEEVRQWSEKFGVKAKEGDDLRTELSALYEKHFLEVKTGGQFLASSDGKNLQKSLEDKAVEAYRASPAFEDEVYQRAFAIHDELVLECRNLLRGTGRVPEDIVLMIGSGVPDHSEHVPDLSEHLREAEMVGVPFDDFGGIENIEALASLPCDFTQEE